VPSQPSLMKFELRHVHGLVHNTSRVVFNDVSQLSFLSETYDVRTKALRVSKPRSQLDYFSARSQRIDPFWDETDTEGPDIHDRETLQLLAKMTNNAYYEDRTLTGWYDLGPEWNTVRSPSLYGTSSVHGGIL
jgi:putative lipase involved disintegration of autophagic bodies